MNSLSLRLAIIFILSLILTILPLPGFLLFLKPLWVLLWLLYLQFYLPGCFHIVILVLLGLVLDALLSTVIGEHAFAFSIVGWIANSKFKRFSFFSMEQQMVVIGLLT